ncbi:MAG: DUF4303 domain-containing protein [Chloroflexi bacterium]|nr:DUF4303 domain-containing protein [Chloroflexota bacterium]
MGDNLDFQLFHNLLYEASRTAFLDIQRTHENETFYFFALNIEPLFGYIFPFSNTEETLTSMAENFLVPGYHPNLSLAEAREIVRWGTIDAPLHHEGMTFFEKVNKFLEPVTEILMEFPHDPWDEFEAFHSRLVGVCIDVLKQLDAEGIFGAGDRRNAILVNIFVGDVTDEQWLKYARELNLDVVYERVATHLEFVRNLEMRL